MIALLLASTVLLVLFFILRSSRRNMPQHVKQDPASVSISRRALDQVRVRRDAMLKRHLFDIEYADANGEITVRTIELEFVRGNGSDLSIKAHCFLRNEQRTFKVNRMMAVADHDTGAPILNPQSYFSAIRNQLRH